MAPTSSQATPAGSSASDRTVALVHEWLAERRGSEKTFEAMAETLPGADLFSLTRDRDATFAFGGRPVRTTVLDRVPGLRHRRALQLPLMPLAWRYATRRSYDVVVTSSHACAKGFRPGREALHLCYCYTPMRYVWLPDVDRRREGGGDLPFTRLAERAMRSWDLASTRWVDSFAAISTAVQARIERFYGRAARVVHPPVDTDWFTPLPEPGRGDFALAVSRMIPYKRLDLVIETCHAIGYPLVVAGSGPDEPRLRALAADLGAEVRFAIRPTDAQLRDLYRTARLVVFPADEDFGIVLVEAQACGAPVVALARGGSLDIVVPGETGVLVPAQDPEALRDGLETALNKTFDEERCRSNAERFARSRFHAEFRSWIVDESRARGREFEPLFSH